MPDSLSDASPAYLQRRAREAGPGQPSGAGDHIADGLLEARHSERMRGTGPQMAPRPSAACNTPPEELTHAPRHDPHGSWPRARPDVHCDVTRLGAAEV